MCCRANAGEIEYCECSRQFATKKPAAVARSIGAASCQALHPVVAAQFLHRHAFLSAWVVHDEVQPTRVQSICDVAGILESASVGAGILGSRVSCLFVRI